MVYWALLVVHVAAASVALLAGFAALFVRKGFSRHRAAGKIFVGAMTGMAVSAVAMAVLKWSPVNVLAGSLTVYMVWTGWLAVQREAGDVRRVDYGLAVFGACVAVGAAGLGIAALPRAGVAFDAELVVPYFGFAVLAMLACGLDISVILRRGILGAPRLRRHIWRLCVALLMTANAFFMPTRFSLPAAVMRSHLNYVPVLYVVIAMAYWMVRVSRTGWALWGEGWGPLPRVFGRAGGVGRSQAKASAGTR